MTHLVRRFAALAALAALALFLGACAMGGAQVESSTYTLANWHG